jgi:hypothetical protein
MAPAALKERIKPKKTGTLHMRIVFKQDTKSKEKMIFLFQLADSKSQILGDLLIGIIEFFDDTKS